LCPAESTPKTGALPNFKVKASGSDLGRLDLQHTLSELVQIGRFSFMLNARPGTFIFVGNGDSAGLHHPSYNFNDEAIPIGTSYWVKLVETAIPVP